MKRSVIFVVVVLMSYFGVWSGSGMAMGAGDAVTVVDLSGEWEFAYMPNPGDKLPEAGRYRMKMPVPGCWDDELSSEKAKGLWEDMRFSPYEPIHYPIETQMPDMTYPYILGAGWYRKAIDVPAEWEGRQVVLHSAYVVAEAKVFVNGRNVFLHQGQCTEWEVNLSKELAYGKPNEIQIAVDNVAYSSGGMRVRGWKGSSSGIFGKVHLKVSGAARITDSYVYREGEELRWEASVEGDWKGKSEIAWRMKDPDNGSVIGRGTTAVDGETVRWKTGTLGMQAWSDRTPKLYTIELTLIVNGKSADEISQRFGMRRLTVDGRKLRLNGEPIFLRGICEESYYPETCTPPIDVELYRKNLSRYREIGYNWLRFHTQVPSEPYMQAADELGILIQIESPSMGTGMKQWRDILRACRRHPSVVIYGGGNEDLMEDPIIEILREWAKEQKLMVPDGLFNPMSGERGISSIGRGDMSLPYQGYGPERVEDPIPHNPVRIQKISEFSEVYQVYAWGDLSHNMLVEGGEQGWIDYRSMLYPGPALSHEMGIIGALLNFDLEKKYEGKRWGNQLYQAAREQMEKWGTYDRWRIYFRHSAILQQLMIKDVTEMARKCRTLAGYNLLGVIDSLWHRCGYECGLLDEFGDFKAGQTAEEILRFNGESILMVSEQWERNLYGKDPFFRRILTSWYAPEALEKGVVSWRFRSTDGTVDKRGEFPVPPLPTGEIAEIGQIGFLCPDLKTPVKAKLEVELATPVRKIVNDWEYWIFPLENPVKPSDVIVVHELKRDTLEKLVKGASVVLMGSKPFETRPLEFKQGKAGRPFHNFATVIHEHPLMDRFPHDGYCSWQFFPMMDMKDRSSAVIFNELNVPFDPILEVASSYKNVKKQGAIFEVRVGKGKLLVCSVNLWAAEPAAEYLRALLQNYAAGEEFSPRTEMKAEELAELIHKAGAAERKEDLPDQRVDPNIHPEKKTK